jgi:hypothetical protein
MRSQSKGIGSADIFNVQQNPYHSALGGASA